VGKIETDCAAKVTYGNSELTDRHQEVLSITSRVMIPIRSDLMFFCVLEEFADVIASNDAGLRIR
jgi:hypothetical protein